MRISDWSSDVCSSDLAPKCAATGLCAIQAEHVSRNVIEGCASLEFACRVTLDACEDLVAIRDWRSVAEQSRVDIGKHVGVLVDLAAEHDAVDVLQLQFA